MADADKLTKEQVKQIFDYGATFNFARSNPDKFHGTFPTDSYEKALDFVYRLVIENERDEECLQCKRYHSGSCIGTINREREEITDRNRCSGFSKYEDGENKDGIN